MQSDHSPTKPVEQPSHSSLPYYGMLRMSKFTVVSLLQRLVWNENMIDVNDWLIYQNNPG